MGIEIGDVLIGVGFGVQGSGFRVQVSGFRVQGAGFRVQGVATNKGKSILKPQSKTTLAKT